MVSWSKSLNYSILKEKIPFFNSFTKLYLVLTLALLLLLLKYQEVLESAFDMKTILRLMKPEPEWLVQS